MPTYDYVCGTCGWKGELHTTIAYRDLMICDCRQQLTRQLAAPMGRVAGRAVQGGGPDRFTADALGIPLKELPTGLRSDKMKPS